MLKPSRVACLESNVVLIGVAEVIALVKRYQPRVLRQLSVKEGRIEIVNAVELGRNVVGVWVSSGEETESMMLPIVVSAVHRNPVVRRFVCPILVEHRVPSS